MQGAALLSGALGGLLAEPRGSGVPPATLPAACTPEVVAAK